MLVSSKLRDFFGLVLLLSILGALGGFAWLTHHPEAPILERAESWTLVGPLATRFRRAYLPPPPPPVSEVAEEMMDVPARERTLPPQVGALDQVWVEPGSVLRREPSHQAPVIAEIEVYANVQKFEQRGDWYRIWRQGQTGWVHLEGYAARQARGEPPLGNEPEAPRPLEPRPPDEERLAAATEYLAGGGRQETLGPYRLYTDSDDEKLLLFLDALAAQVEDLYTERYRLRPLGEAQAAIVLYQREGAYRMLQARSADLVGLNAAGHATSGLAAFYIGRRQRAEIAGTLIHELVHLLNRRALGPALPPWLDEGLADDLALSAIGADGRIDPSVLSSERQRQGTRVTHHGGTAALLQLRDRLRHGRLLPLQELTELDWRSFVKRSRQRSLYAHSTFWIRFLLSAEDGRYRAAFQGYLAGIASGASASGETLRRHLDREWSALDAAFRAWIEFKAVKIR